MCNNIEELRLFLEQVAAKGTSYDNDEDFGIYEASGNNLDDAYSIGADDGRIELAKELLSDYFRS